MLVFNTKKYGDVLANFTHIFRKWEIFPELRCQFRHYVHLISICNMETPTFIQYTTELRKLIFVLILKYRHKIKRQFSGYEERRAL